MKKTFFLLIVCCSLVIGAEQGQAVTLSTPSFTITTLSVGDSYSVDVNISGLNAGGAPTLGAFSFDLFFDNSILDFSSVVFGNSLGIAGIEAITGFDTPTAGVVSLFEVSLLSTPDLDAFQSSIFTLATLTFKANALGTSPLGLGNIVLSNADGNSLGENVVPEPSTILLLGIGLVVLVVFRKKFGINSSA